MKRTRTKLWAIPMTLTVALAACGGSDKADPTIVINVSTPSTVAALSDGSQPVETVAAAAGTTLGGTNTGEAITKKEREAMMKSIKSGGADDKISECVTTELAKLLTRDEFNQVAKAKKESDVSADVAEKANSVAVACALGDDMSTTVAVPETTIAVATQKLGTKDAPIAFGTVIALDNGYDVTVNKYVADATAAVLAANSLNDKPAPGQRYVMVNMSIKNVGGDTDKRQPAFDMPLKAVSASGTAYEGSSCSAVLPDALPWFDDVFKGSTITGNVCFIVADADAEGLTMYLDVYTKDFATFTYYFNMA